MGTKHTPQEFAQKYKAGRGWSIVRNSARLAETDYERIADDIVAALNYKVTAPDLLAERDRLKAVNAELVKALETMLAAVESGLAIDERGESCPHYISQARAVLAKVQS